MIRVMQEKDIECAFAIEKKVQIRPWSKHQFVEAQKNYSATVIEINGVVVGFCVLQPVLDEANLLLMAVDPICQGQGLGYQLLIESIERLKNNPIQIFLEVRESNYSAIGLYEKSGFHQIDLRKNYYPTLNGNKEHAVIMVKTCSDDFSKLFSHQ